MKTGAQNTCAELCHSRRMIPKKIIIKRVPKDKGLPGRWFCDLQKVSKHFEADLYTECNCLLPNLSWAVAREAK